MNNTNVKRKLITKLLVFYRKNGRGKTTLLRMLLGAMLPGNGFLCYKNYKFQFSLKLRDIRDFLKRSRSTSLGLI